MLLKRCRDAGYDCHLVHSEEEVIEQLEEMKRHQAVIVVDTCHKSAGSSAAAAGKTFSSGKRVPESSLEKLSRLVYRYTWEVGLLRGNKGGRGHLSTLNTFLPPPLPKIPAGNLFTAN